MTVRIGIGVDTYDTPGELDLSDSTGQLALVINPPTLYIFTSSGYQPLASLQGATVPPPVVNAASETAAGVAELATQAETDLGSDTSRIVTPAKLAGRTATEERSGVVELATAAETQAGTDSTRVIHPAGFKAGITPGAWIAPTLLNGWQNMGSPWQVSGYRKDPLGAVELRGGLGGGTMTDLTPILVLPVGYRPSARRTFLVAAGAGTTATVRVEADGNVRLNYMTNNTFLSLEGVRFDV